MPEQVNGFTGLLVSAGLVLLIAVIVLLILLLRREKKQQTRQKEYYRSLQEELRRLQDYIYSLPGREEQSGRMHELSESFARGLENILVADDRRAESMASRLDGFGSRMDARLEQVTRSMQTGQERMDARSEAMRQTVEKSLQNMQTDNARKLDEMRETVDEKLHSTLEKRLSESFSTVSERLEQVYKGLGEMRTLAGGVGDLKKVLSNVKTRGIWGEMQLGNILSQMFAPGQYAENVEVEKGSGRRVEYAVILPGRDEGNVLLPIDSKFPVEAYERLLQAAENGDKESEEQAGIELENAFRTEGRRICEKYIRPPFTTDFAVMFVPVEGLYAEALQRRGLAEYLQEKLRIIVAGPTTLTALLTSLQVGFRTLAIEKRSGEVWQLLGAVKTEFSAFTDLLEAAQKRMNTVTETIERASRRSRTIERKLKQVEGLEASDAVRLLENENGEQLAFELPLHKEERE